MISIRQVRPIECQRPVGIRVFKTANQPDSFIFGLGNVTFFHVFSLSINPDDRTNAWPSSFTHVLAESFRWQSGDLVLFNPTVVGFCPGMPFVERKNWHVKSGADFIAEIWLISLHWKEIIPTLGNNFRGELSLAEDGITGDNLIFQSSNQGEIIAKTWRMLTV